MTASEAIRKRKSIRAYQEKPVDSGDLEKIIEAGQWAPNAGTFQISVITDKVLQQNINDLTHQAMKNSPVEFLRQRAALPGYQPLYSAPVLILLSGPEKAPVSPINAALAAQNMILEATELGLGTCFLFSPTSAMNAPENRSVAEEAGIPEGYSLQCAVLVGHPAEENRFSLPNRDPKGKVFYRK